MATPAPVSITVASGATAYVGRPSPLPAWVPALGAVADAGLNTINDVKGASNAGSIFLAWSGAAFAPWWGDAGSLIYSGGGHTDGSDNDVYRYDIGTRLTSKIKDRAPVFVASDTYIGDWADTGWMWGDTGATTKQVGEPVTAHFYSQLLAVPPAARAGAPNGWLVTMGRAAVPLAGQTVCKQAHRLALGTATKWELQGGGNLVRAPVYGPTLYDSLRNRVVALVSGGIQGIPYTSMADDTVGVLASGYVDAYYGIGAYHAAQDVYMHARFAGTTLTLKIIDPVTGVISTPTTTGTPPTETEEGAWDWVESWGAWVYYPGAGGNNIYTLKSPSNAKTGPWLWAKQTVTGTARAIQSGAGGPAYNRLRYAPAVDCVMWAARYNEPVQAFRISAP